MLVKKKVEVEEAQLEVMKETWHRIYPRMNIDPLLGEAIRGVPHFVLRVVREKEEVQFYLLSAKTEKLLQNFEVIDLKPERVPDLSKYKWKATLTLSFQQLTSPLKVYDFENVIGFLEKGMALNIVGKTDEKLNKLVRRRVAQLRGHRTFLEESVAILGSFVKALTEMFVPSSSHKQQNQKAQPKKEALIEEIRELEKRALQPIYAVTIEIYGDNKKLVKQFANDVAMRFMPRPDVKVMKNRGGAPEEPTKYKISVADEEMIEFLKLPQLASSVARGGFLPPTIEDVDTEDVVVLGFKRNGYPFVLDLKDFFRHVYVLGMTGSGKSNTLEVLVNELKKKFGDEISIWVIDPHGDLAIDLLLQLGDDKTYFLDPVRTGFKINPMELSDYDNRKLAVLEMISELMGVFENVFQLDLFQAPNVRLLLSVGPRYLYNEKKMDNPTLPDLLQFYLDLYNGEIDIDSVQDKQLRDTLKLVSKMPDQSFISTVSRLYDFASDDWTRTMFSGNTVDFWELIQPGTLVLWRISKAEVPSHLQPLIMSVIVMRLWFVIKQRYKQYVKALEQGKKVELTPIILVIDEFQNIQELKLLDVIFTEARKFGFHLVLAHQNLSQIDEKLIRTILANTGVQIIMKVSGEDTETLVKNIDWSNRDVLQEILPNLKTGEAVVKKSTSYDKDTLPQQIKIPKAPPWTHPYTYFYEVIEKMRARFGAEDVTSMVATNPIENVFGIISSEVEYKLIAMYWAIAKITGDIFEIDEKDTKKRPTLSRVAKTIGKRTDKIQTWIDEYSTLRTTPLIEVMPLQGGIVKLVLPTKDGLDMVFGNIQAVAPSTEGQWLAKKAINYYLSNANEPVLVQAVTLGRERPDLVVIPTQFYQKPRKLKYDEAIAVEIESTNEVIKHPEAVKNNMLKGSTAYFKEIHVWAPKNVVEKVVEIYGGLPEAYRQKIKIFAVDTNTGEIENVIS